MSFSMFFNSINQGQKEFASKISIIVNSFLLSIVYFIGVGPISLIAHKSGKHFLTLRKSHLDDSYWKKLEKKEIGLIGGYKQF